MLRHRALHQGNCRAYTFLVDGETENAALTYGQLDQSRARHRRCPRGSRGEPGRSCHPALPAGPGFHNGVLRRDLCGRDRRTVLSTSPLAARSLAPRLTAIIANAEPSVVLCPAEVAALSAWVAHAPALGALPWIATDTLGDDAAASWKEPDVGPSTLAFLQYTSGSTAAPRGVMVTHGNLLHNLAVANHVEENDDDSVSVSWLPVIHDMGLIEGVLEPAYAGYPAYLMSPATFLQRPIRWLRAITKYRATNSGGPNFAYDLCARKISAEQRDTLDLSSWRVAYNGAEPIRSGTLTAFNKTFRDCGFRWKSFYPVYGLAESTLVVTSGRSSYQPVFLDADASALRRWAALKRPRQMGRPDESHWCRVDHLRLVRAFSSSIPTPAGVARRARSVRSGSHRRALQKATGGARRKPRKPLALCSLTMEADRICARATLARSSTASCLSRDD